MQEIKAASSDSNPGVPNQYTHPQINFTRGHASLENGKTLLVQKKYIGCVLVREVLFIGFSILIARNQKDFVPNASFYL